MKLERARAHRPDDPRIKTLEADAEREERQRSMEPPVVTRALARQRLQQQARAETNNPLVPGSGLNALGAMSSRNLLLEEEDELGSDNDRLSASISLAQRQARARREIVKNELDALEVCMRVRT